MSKKKLLITGALGGLARYAANALKDDYDIVGIDPRHKDSDKKSNLPFELIRAEYTGRKISDIFRTHQFDAFLHLGRIPVTEPEKSSTRFNINVLGTKNLLEHVRIHNIQNTVVMSSFHVYGAHAHNPLYITEDAPLKASHSYPELADSVEMDNLGLHFSLKHKDLTTVILRPVNIIGPRINNQISRMLRSDLVPIVMGYDPMQQYIYEEDVMEAIRLTLHSKTSGVYNVAGEGLVPFSKAIELVGGTAISIPPFLQFPVMAALRVSGFQIQKHLIDFYKFPTVISDEQIRKDFGYSPKFSTISALNSLKKHILSK